MTTLKERVRIAFAQPPVSFPLMHQEDTNAAVSHRGAVLQTPRDTKAVLIVTMPADSAALVRRNTNLLIVLLLASGWTADGTAWLTSRLKSAAQSKDAALRYPSTQEGLSYTLLVDKGNALVTLTVEEATT
jgi:hypothetical protein